MRLASAAATLLLVVSAGNAIANTATPATAKVAAKPSAPPTAADIKEVGVPGVKRREGNASIGEYLRLQEEIELRKLREAVDGADAQPKVSAPASKPIIPPAEVAVPVRAPASTEPAKVSPTQAASPVARAPQLTARPWEPQGKWIRTMVIGAHSIADIEMEGRVRRYREGDALGDWMVRRISNEGVWVDRKMPPVLGPSGVLETQVDPQTGASRFMTVKLSSGFVAGQPDAAPPVEGRPQFERQLPIPAAPAVFTRPDSTALKSAPPLPVR